MAGSSIEKLKSLFSTNSSPLSPLIDALVPTAHASDVTNDPTPGSLPGWMQSALSTLQNTGNSLSNGYDATSRDAHLGYHTGLQALGNLLARLPTGNEDLKNPLKRDAFVPGTRRDVAGEKLRDQLAQDLNPFASAYVGQVPVGSFWNDQADIAHQDHLGRFNPSIDSNHQLQTATVNGGGAFRSNQFGRNKESTFIPPEWSMSPSGDPNSNSLDQVPGTGIYQDPSTTNLSMDQQQQTALKNRIYHDAIQASGGVDLNKFGQDYQQLRQDHPELIQELTFLSQPFYKDISNQAFAQYALAHWAASHGNQMKNTPMARHYEGILK